MPPEDPSFPPSASEPRSRLATRSSMIRDLKLEEISQERWREFELVYKPLLLCWIKKKRVPDSAEVEILQECWVSAFKAIGKFDSDSDKGSFRGWLRTIVHRRVADYFRSLPKDHGVSQEVLDGIVAPEQKDDGEIEAEKQALREIEARALEVVRSTMKEDTWKMFWMNCVEKVPTDEVAQQFGVSTAAVRMAKKRVLKRLRGLGFEI